MPVLPRVLPFQKRKSPVPKKGITGTSGEVTGSTGLVVLPVLLPVLLPLFNRKVQYQILELAVLPLLLPVYRYFRQYFRSAKI